MLKGKVESVTLVKHISEKMDYCEITIDFDRIHAYGYYNDFLSYIGKYVEYNTKQEMVDGVITTLIASFADQYAVQTIEKTENIKLLPGDKSCRPTCNFAVKDLKYGEVTYGAVCLLSSWEHGASMKSKWIDCTMVDKNSQVFLVKIFATDTDGEESIEELLDELVGKYVKLDIYSTKYGLQTEKIEFVNVPVLAAPEVLIAETILNGYIAEDNLLQEYIHMHDMMEILKRHIRVDIGYELVYMAAELSLIQNLENISDVYDFTALKRAIFATRGHLLPCKTKFSKTVRNFNNLARSPLKSDKELLLIVDPLSEEDASLTKKVYYKIHKFAKEIIDERRGLNEESSDGNTINRLAGLDGLL